MTHSIQHQTVANPDFHTDVQLTQAILTEPELWTKEQIQILPIEYLKKLPATTLWDIWNDLEENKRTNDELRAHLPCLEHYNRPEYRDHIDGPPLPRFRCALCQQIKPLSP